MEDCIFCKIVRKEIPSQVVYEDDRVLAFKDINPLAPVHILIIPKEHLTNVLDIHEDNVDLIGHIHLVANKIARDTGIAEKGFRIVTNCNKEGGQIIFHLHYHLIGGEELRNFA
ncbi:histidine triad (HIT) protein [Thermincola ferriacetica]|uniref:Histidine triad (HIT) protein n=2 Tax=Thermincola TaxID=278993 RepID=D5XAT0_THEPJ|nr:MULTISPECIES: histidine triad nucleotide-binding protein [Thermincola]ADG83284.1 histidine triad (HIT) protein [Thermincola potens JR]KNZ68818.1 histidine triad (HIT) protein [Thermincola ferriacetica]